MAESGKILGERNISSFESFVEEREEANDWERFISPSGKKLKRNEICLSCGFKRTAFVQNPGLRKRLKDIEEELSKKGVLKNNLNQENQFDYQHQEDFIKNFKDELIELRKQLGATETNLENFREYFDRLG